MNARAQRMRPRLGLLGLVAVAAPMALTCPAPAQFGRAAAFGEVTSPYYLSRDLRIFEQTLGLDDGQALILQSIFWDYTDDQEAATERMKQRFDEMQEQLREMDRDAILQVIFQPLRERAAGWEDLNDQFLESVQVVLNDEQRQRWPALRRELRRAKEMAKGEYSGESVNLFQVIQELDFERPIVSKIQPLLDAYELQLEEALKRRQQLQRGSRLLWIETIQSNNPSEQLDTYEKLVQARIAVRKVNDNAIEAIAAALPDTYARQFRQAALERGYERIFRPTATQRMFDAALKLEELAPETLEAIGQLQIAYLAELNAMNNNLLRLVRSHEAQADRDRAKKFAMRRSGQSFKTSEDPTREAFRDRDALDRRYAEQLEALLTPEQFESLPGARRLGANSAKSAPKRLPKTPRGGGVGTTPPDGYRGPGAREPRRGAGSRDKGAGSNR